MDKSSQIERVASLIDRWLSTKKHPLPKVILEIILNYVSLICWELYSYKQVQNPLKYHEMTNFDFFSHKNPLTSVCNTFTVLSIQIFLFHYRKS